MSVVEAARAPPPLRDIVDALKRNLALDGTWPEVVDAACLQLGVAPTGSLQEKGDACWRAMEGNACTSPWKDNACSSSRRGMGKVAPDPTDPTVDSSVVAWYWYQKKNCLNVELRSVGSSCGPFRIEEDTVANDQRILARVSGEEARTYIRGVNARIAKSTRCYRWSMRGCYACVFLGAALFGVMMELFYEKKRLRCTSRLCDVDRGEDPLVDGCCIFWCCGGEMEEKKRELPARPYDTSWDVWSNKTYFNITELCSLYDEDRPEDHTKRDAEYKCRICPRRGSTCKTMFEGNAKDYEVTWPLLILIPFLVPFVCIVFLGAAYDCAVSRLYGEAFEDWRARGVVTHVNSQQTTCCMTNRVGYLGLWFNDDGCYTLPPGKHEPGRIILDASQEIVRLNLPMVLRESCTKNGPGLTDSALPAELAGRVPEEVWIKHTAKLGPIFKRLRSTATNVWCTFCSLIPIFIPFDPIHANHVAKKVDKDLRAWQTSFNADLASHGVFVKTQSTTRTSDDGYGPPAQRWLAVALTANEAADLKAEPHLFGGRDEKQNLSGGRTDKDCCIAHCEQRDACLHTMRE